MDGTRPEQATAVGHHLRRLGVLRNCAEPGLHRAAKLGFHAYAESDTQPDPNAQANPDSNPIVELPTTAVVVGWFVVADAIRIQPVCGGDPEARAGAAIGDAHLDRATSSVRQRFAGNRSRGCRIGG
ncbi:MAG: hypothetical protein M3P14_10710 [Chloroflexota bacterium]|nr:hypothetical protein [Chloroflexota bacterium]